MFVKELYKKLKTHVQFYMKTAIGTYCSVESVVKGPFFSQPPPPLILFLFLNFLQWAPRPLTIQYTMYFYAGVLPLDDISCFFEKNLLSLSLFFRASYILQ